MARCETEDLGAELLQWLECKNEELSATTEVMHIGKRTKCCNNTRGGREHNTEIHLSKKMSIH